MKLNEVIEICKENRGNDLTHLSVGQMAQAYNQIVEVLERRPIKKFENRSIATARLTKLFEEVAEMEAAITVSAVLEPAPEVEVDLPATPVEEVAPVLPTPAVEDIEATRAYAKAAVKDSRRKRREKVFCYPPLADGIKAIAADSLRGKALAMLREGATFDQIEQFCAGEYAAAGKTHKCSVADRAYGLIRVIHTYVGYALIEEMRGDVKVIRALDGEEWKAHKASKKTTV